MVRRWRRGGRCNKTEVGVESTTTLFEQLTLLVAVGLLGPALAGAIPSVVGELAVGAIVGTTGFGWINAGTGPFPAFYALGFSMLMLTAGTHVDIQSRTLRSGFFRGVRAFAVTAVLALGAGFVVAAATGLDKPLFLGVLIAGGSAAVAFPIIEERGLSGPTIDFLIAWIAIADASTVIVMPLTLSGNSSVGLALLGDAGVLVVGAAVLAVMLRVETTWVARGAAARSIREGWALHLRISVLLLVGLSAIAAVAGASTLLAGFVAGAVLVRLHKSKRLDIQFTGLANGFFVPLFFVLLGAKLDLRALFGDAHALVLALAMGVAACVVHVVAAMVAAPAPRRWVSGLSASAQLGLPAAAASIGLQTQTLSPAIASAIVAGACLSLIPATVGSVLLARTLPARHPLGSDRD